MPRANARSAAASTPHTGLELRLGFLRSEGPPAWVTSGELAVYRRLRRICRSCSNTASAPTLTSAPHRPRFGHTPATSSPGKAFAAIPAQPQPLPNHTHLRPQPFPSHAPSPATAPPVTLGHSAAKGIAALEPLHPSHSAALTRASALHKPQRRPPDRRAVLLLSLDYSGWSGVVPASPVGPIQLTSRW